MTYYPPRLLNEELYMLKLSAMSDEDIQAEKMHCELNEWQHKRCLEHQQAQLFTDRLSCIKKYKQMQQLLELEDE
ncbi:hypothetical protein PYDG_00021 [Pseudoalteromonas phage pYD6-A]|uniref:Uncharacterized protein n=1 Tax=Pseudoalteromonas phage pYD6-A TaxID=754052 RepID=M4SND4_9CAUD|nr:hypothetical protein PYDG_00021 [Pseudoalteromonas phage pYD6-A]AGH57553.1 hypothetical protein PYDG_00021 [Pseudoalteromonas phage pYD6-A]